MHVLLRRKDQYTVEFYQLKIHSSNYQLLNEIVLLLTFQNNILHVQLL